VTPTLPAVPAGDLAPGQALPVEDVIGELVAVSKDDPGMASTLERSVLVDVFESIRDGHKDPAGLAECALRVLRTRFERW
jgi:hypothetical protein